MPVKIELSEADRVRIVRLYTDDWLPASHVAREMGHGSPKVVRRVLREEGIPLRTGRGSKAPPPAPREVFVRMAGQQMSAAEIGECLDVSDETARRWLVRFGVDRLPAQARPEKNAFWSGGRTVDRVGYVMAKMNHHPRANHLGYVREHRLVMEAELGRLLTATEVVDHRNGIVDDNRPVNLRVFATNADHLRATLTGRSKQSQSRRQSGPDAPTPTASETGADQSRSQHPLGPWPHGTKEPSPSGTIGSKV